MTSISPFAADYRASGLLLHVTSLPSPYGIGDLGRSAFQWIDSLHDAHQKWWQVLPLGPTGYGNSPYQSLSSFAGNPLMISPGVLIADGLLAASDCEGHFASEKVDYDFVIPLKERLLETAWTNFNKGSRKDLRASYQEFCAKQVHWLEDYALFRALKARYGGVSYLKWPPELVRRTPQAMEKARTDLAREMDRVRFSQFLLFRQTDGLKAYAHSKGVSLIGDLPFFVSPDSSDVWSNPEFFLLDEQHQPQFVAGVPPDYFSAQGQLWGNPVYNWSVLRQSGYRWCIDRLRALLAHVDVIRLDHFRGFVAAWHVPAGAKTAQFGEWVPGPGADYFQAVQKELGCLPFIAEDLGTITPDVRALRDEFKVAGTRVLQFAFDGHADNPYLPEHYVANTVVYTGTHDNATTREWYDGCTDSQRKQLWGYLKRAPGETKEVARAMMGLAFDSVAALAIAPLQDLLNMGKEARMNVPGSSEGNWRWRCSESMLAPAAFEWLKELTDGSKRSA